MPSTNTFRNASWVVADCDEREVLRLARELEVAAPVARILLARGLSEIHTARRFLNPSLADHMHAPNEMHGMDVAAQRIRTAISRNEPIRVVSDYDVDGTTASVILQHTLRILGFGSLVSYHIPSRFDEGYGFSVAAAERAAADGAGVIVTCDIGVRDHTAVRAAKSLGVDVLVADHHLPPGEDVPDGALAVLCPKQDRCDYENKELAACGLALKLAQTLLKDHPKQAEIVRSLAKIAAIGTVADMVGLNTAENRAIVYEGLRGLSQPSRNHGLTALLDASGLGGRSVTTGDCGFKIGPRINAAGRLAAATTVIEMFNAESYDQAFGFAQELNRLNLERQQVQHRLVDTVVEDLASLTATPHVALFAGEEAAGWHRGVVGIVATRVVEMANRPAFVVSIDGDGIGRGSARTAAGIHLVNALESCSDILVKFGGNAAAAGFTVKRDNIDELRQRLGKYIESTLTSDEDLRPRFRVDAQLSLDEVDVPMLKGLTRLEPHGIGNPKPVFVVEGATVRRLTKMKDKHLKLVLSGSSGGAVQAVWWDGIAHEERCAPDSRLDLVVTCDLNEYQGMVKPQLTIKDARPAQD